MCSAIELPAIIADLREMAGLLANKHERKFVTDLETIARTQEDRADDANYRARLSIIMARDAMNKLQQLQPGVITPDMMALAVRMECMCANRLAELRTVYSPDDSANDWADKIRSLQEAKG